MGTKDLFSVGCDVGSTTGKAIVLQEETIFGTAIIPREIEPEAQG